MIGAPSKFRFTRKPDALARMLPHFDFSTIFVAVLFIYETMQLLFIMKRCSFEFIMNR